MTEATNGGLVVEEVLVNDHTCVTCNEVFTLSVDHEQWFLNKGLMVPTHCPVCIRTKKEIDISSIQTNELIEKLSENVHAAWLKEKEKQGFHAPVICEGFEHRSYMKSSDQAKERFYTAGLTPELYKWCDKCHTDMYPYDSLSENIKEYDRVTVRTVLEALHSLGKRLV